MLLKVKEEIKTALDERMHEEIIEQVLVNDRIVIPSGRFEYPLPYNAAEPEPLYTSVSRNEVDVHGDGSDLMAREGQHGAEESHGGGHGEAAESGHGAPAGHGEPAGHGAPSGGHGEASAGHGEPADDSTHVDFSIEPSGAEYVGVQTVEAGTGSGGESHGGGHGSRALAAMEKRLRTVAATNFLDSPQKFSVFRSNLLGLHREDLCRGSHPSR